MFSCFFNLQTSNNFIFSMLSCFFSPRARNTLCCKCFTCLLCFLGCLHDHPPPWQTSLSARKTQGDSCSQTFVVLGCEPSLAPPRRAHEYIMLFFKFDFLSIWETATQKSTRIHHFFLQIWFSINLRDRHPEERTNTSFCSSNMIFYQFERPPPRRAHEYIISFFKLDFQSIWETATQKSIRLHHFVLQI